MTLQAATPPDERERVLSQFSPEDRALIEEIERTYPRLFHAIGRL